jgi:hypothetical protein
MLDPFAVDIANALKVANILSAEKTLEIASFLSEQNITELEDAYDKLNGISYKTVVIPERVTNVDATIGALRIWWRLKLGAIKESNPTLFNAWNTKASLALANYNENETVRRNSAIVDGVETNNFIEFKNGALQYGIITEGDLDELFQTVLSPEITQELPYREIDRIMGTDGNIISLRDLEQILEVI